MVAANLTYHLSASSIAAFKACPQRFRLAYREGLRLIEDTESQRMGTNWHAMHECYANTYQKWMQGSPEATVEGAERESLQAVGHLLNERYAGSIPNSKTPEEWSLERTLLLISFIGYLWYWQNDPVEFIASEVPFNLPLMAPKVNLPLPMSEVQRVGKIDHIIKWQGAVCALERKSTSRSIDADSDYWDKSKKDTQVSMYALAFRDMLNADKDDLFNTECERFGNTLYDVWHKPTIKPADLTQKDTAAFLDSGEYMGTQFQLAVTLHPNPTEENKHLISVNGAAAEVTMGKKGFAIRETVEMFGARLLQDIYKRPEFYYARREISRTDGELYQFKSTLFAVYTAQKSFERSGCWFENESQCRATYACPYIPICYGEGADKVCASGATPNGFKRIFVDLTVNGQEVEA
jgi:hypothetical protein